MPTRFFYDPQRRAVITIESPTAPIPTGVIEIDLLESQVMRLVIVNGLQAVRETLDWCEDERGAL